MQPWTSFQRFRTPLEADYDISKVWNSLEMDQYFENPELFRGGLVQNSLEVDWYFEGSELFRSGPVQNSLEADRLDSLLQKTIKVRNFNPKWTRIFRKSESSNLKQTRLEHHFETDQICGFRIPSGLNFEGSWISGSFLKHNLK
ncbi:hypothetical protein RclHR1_30400002 [Rhizophagus clarus]|uniref:Uncharacterized protein n=1 Tax=Rhizophagus clarus TaxID=94130 RepID=A0A2Z6S0R1_9GLOM|nr:hypothetical protein RclHR1_30400002 [Rhizophagus clarus]